MSYRKVPLVNDNYYHIYNRGNNKHNIFFENKNYHFLLSRVQQNITKSSEIIAYCLMPNHYHFIIKVIDSENFIKGIQKTFISYSKAINAKYNRTGHLFEGRYKYKIISENNYLLHLSRYIHLNPVRANLVTKPEGWQYSSYSEYIGTKELGFIKPKIVLAQVEDYNEFVVSYQEDQQYSIKKLLF